MVVVWIEAFLLGYTDIFHNKQTETITLFQANKSDSLHFFQRISPITIHFFKRIECVSYRSFLILWPIFYSQAPSWKEKHTANHRNPKKTTTFASNKRSVTYLRKCSIIQYLVSDSGHSTKELKRDGTTRICKTMKYNGLHLSLHSVYLSKQRLYRLKWMVTDNQWCKYAASESVLTLYFHGETTGMIWLFSSCLLYTSPSPRDTR